MWLRNVADCIYPLSSDEIVQAQAWDDCSAADFTLASPRPYVAREKGMDHVIESTGFAQECAMEVLMYGGREEDAEMAIPGCLQNVPGALVRL